MVDQWDRLDFVQLRCPPSSVYGDDAVFDALDTLVGEGRIASYGVSVEKVSEALEAIARPGVGSVQIIANAFRLKPFEQVIPQAKANHVSIIVRVPLTSGLLSGRFTEETTFPANDHRTFNREREAFDVGVTFGGVPFADDVAAAREFAALVPHGVTPALATLAWLTQQDGVTTVIPGASSPEQAKANAAAGSLAPLSADFDTGVHRIYDRLFRAKVRNRW